MTRGYTRLYVDHVQQADRAPTSTSWSAERLGRAAETTTDARRAKVLITDFDFPDIELERGDLS